MLTSSFLVSLETKFILTCFLTCKYEKMILKWYIVKLFLWKLRGERIGLCNETNGNTFGHSYTFA